MEISDLFDAQRRDDALRALSDEDLIIAAVAVTQQPPSCSLQTEWLAMDLAGFILHTTSAASASVIATRALNVITPRVMFDAMAKMGGYREPPRDLRRIDDTASSRKLAHIVALPAFAAVLGDVCRREIERLITGEAQRPDNDLLGMLFAFVNDPDVIAPLLRSERIFAHGQYMQRLWDLDAGHLVIHAATDEDAPWYVRTAAASFLKSTAAMTSKR